MTNDDKEQFDRGASMTSNSSRSDDEPYSLEESPPPIENIHEFHSWLMSQNGPIHSTILSRLPNLVEIAQNEGHEAPVAGSIINHILQETIPPIDSAELIHLLDNQYIDQTLLLEHLGEIYPRECSIDVGSVNLEFVNQLPTLERMEAYRVLCRLPPSPSIYTCLNEVNDIFNGRVTVGSETLPLESYYTGYATRTLHAAIKHPDTVSPVLTDQILRQHPWRSLRVIAANAKDTVNPEITQDLATVLRNKSTPTDHFPGRIIQQLCNAYSRENDPEIRNAVGELIEQAVSAGVYPAQWEQSVSQLVSSAVTDRPPDTIGSIIAVILHDVEPDSQLVSTIFPPRLLIREFRICQSVWNPVLELYAEEWPELLIEHIGELVTISRDANARTNTIFDILAAVGKQYPQIVLTEIEPLVRDLPQSDRTEEIDGIRRILLAVNSYPPPPTLFELYGSTDVTIDAKAKKTVRDLRRRFRESTPQILPGEVNSLREFAEEYTILRRTGVVSWQPLSLPDAEFDLVQQVAQIGIEMNETEHVTEGNQFESDREGDNFDPQSTQFVVSSNDPAWVELAVLGASIAQIISPDLRVALHSPATGGWGTKKDIRAALENYGIAKSNRSDGEVIPLFDVIPTARITNGELTIESTSTTISNDPPSLTLVRDLESLNSASADLILYNYLSGIDAENALQLRKWRGTHQESPVQEPGKTIAESSSSQSLINADEVKPDSLPDDHPDQPFHIEIHGLFTAQYADNRRQHIGPLADLPQPRLLERKEVHSQSEDNSSETYTLRTALSLTSDASPIEVRSVDSEQNIDELLERLDQYIDQVGGEDAERALRSFRYTISSLPVPIDLHDTWVREQIDQGNQWVPRRIHSRRNGIRNLADEAILDAEILDLTLITIDTLIDELSDRNPLGEELLNVLDEAAMTENSVGVLCRKKTYKDMLDIYLRDRATDWILGDDLLILDEDTIRNITSDDIDWLITFDALPPQSAIYYHHPAVSKMIVVGYPEGTLSSRVYWIDQKRRPYLPTRLEIDLPELEVELEESELKTVNAHELSDDLYRTYLSVAGLSLDNEQGESGTHTEIQRYRLEFENAPARTLWNAHPMIIRSEEHLVSAGEFGLRSLQRIQPGDEMVLVDSRAQRDLWEEFLREDWRDTEDELDTGETFMEAVDLWFEAVEAGLNANSDTGELSEGISGFADEITPEVSVGEHAVKDWARGVIEGESGADLVFRSDLRIGPRYPDAVKAVARKYGSKRMEENWEEVYKRMKAIRTTNRQRGSVFWDWIADRASDGDLFGTPGIHEVTVKSSRRLD